MKTMNFVIVTNVKLHKAKFRQTKVEQDAKYDTFIRALS
jgi:hypothetical protein